MLIFSKILNYYIKIEFIIILCPNAKLRGHNKLFKVFRTV